MSACIPTQRAKNSQGYGYISHGGRMVGEHRLVYCNHHGIAIEDIAGKVIRHTCDNRWCINPMHLLIGTHTDNMKDMAERGRTSVRYGEDHPNTSLTWDDVLNIRALRADGAKTTELARRFGVSQPTISAICLHRVWRER